MGRFKKGESGNPGGRPKEIGDLRQLARERTQTALSTLENVMTDPMAPAAARVSAACALLDRGYGRPAQTLAVDREETPVSVKVTDRTLNNVAFLMRKAMEEGMI